MEKTLKLKPLGDFVVTNPQTMAPLPPEGEVVVLSNYWQRRINEGAVAVVMDAPTAKKGGEK